VSITTRCSWHGSHEDAVVSRAFVKESDGAEADQGLPELRVSEHRNLVTAAGLALIESSAHKSEAELAAARAAGDTAATARHARDLRYWVARRVSAQVVPPPTDASKVRFGCTVALERADGDRVAYRIVGEDEAAPAAGRISYVSPLAAALLGQELGVCVRIGDVDATIVAIEP
jgi:transcription elongation GreA/GreB family factor